MTLFTLGTDDGRVKAFSYAMTYLLISIFVMIFGFVYELYGHGVHSDFMVYAFAVPLIGGTLFWMLMSRTNKQIIVNRGFTNLLSATIATFTVGCIYKGILDIYGTAGNLTKIYWIAGSILFIGTVIAFAAGGSEDNR